MATAGAAVEAGIGCACEDKIAGLATVAEFLMVLLRTQKKMSPEDYTRLISLIDAAKGQPNPVKPNA